MDLCPSCGEPLSGRLLGQTQPQRQTAGLGPRQLHRCPACRRLASRDENTAGAWLDSGPDPSLDYMFDWKPERLPEPWVFTPADRRPVLEAELRAEVAEGHPLFGQPVNALAHCEGCDDVIFTVAIEDGWIALVHLTWRRQQEPRPWPATERLTGPISRALRTHTH
jgi:hypothetical protein